jgi:WD40 repeat protein
MLKAFEDNGSSAINRALFAGSDLYLITAGDNGSMIWWNLKWSNETKPMYGSAKEKIEKIALSPSGENIAAIGQRSGIMILNTANMYAPPEFLTTQTIPQSVFFSPHKNESFLLAVLSDWSLQSWKFTRAGIEKISTQPTVNISNIISFNEAGDRLAAFDLDGKPVVTTFPQFDTLLNPERIMTSGTTSIALSPDGRMLAAGYENVINIWRLETRSGFLVIKISSEAADHRWLSFSADGKKLYAIGKTGSVIIYPIQ